jgi:hypothetical protein
MRDLSRSFRVGTKHHPEAAAEGSLLTMNEGRHKVCPYGETLHIRSGWERGVRDPSHSFRVDKEINHPERQRRISHTSLFLPERPFAFAQGGNGG